MSLFFYPVKSFTEAASNIKHITNPILESKIFFSKIFHVQSCLWASPAKIAPVVHANIDQGVPFLYRKLEKCIKLEKFIHRKVVLTPFSTLRSYRKMIIVKTARFMYGIYIVKRPRPIYRYQKDGIAMQVFQRDGRDTRYLHLSRKQRFISQFPF